MTEFSPKSVLAMYRRESNISTSEQAAMFMAMPPEDRQELLFYMIMSSNVILQMLHERIDPTEAKIQGMPEETPGN